MSQYIFVYGTLKRGGHNNPHLAGCEFVGVGRAWGCVLLDFGGFPGMIPANIGNRDTSSVFGEVYAVPEENWQNILARLDTLEHAYKAYLRVKIPVNVGNSVKECTTYLFMLSLKAEDVVPKGRWPLPTVREEIRRAVASSSDGV